MCVFTCFILLLQQKTLPRLYVYRTLRSEGIDYLIFRASHRLPFIYNRRHQLAFYAFRLLVDMATITPIFTGRSDLPTREISTPSLLGGKAEMFHIVNCYSVWGSTATERTVSPPLALPATSFPTLVVRDFNIHHPLADLMRRHNSSELQASFLYFSQAAEH